MNMKKSWAPIAIALTVLGSASSGAQERKHVVRVISSDDGGPGIERQIVIMDDNNLEPVVALPGFRRSRGYLGVQLVDLTPELRAHFGLPDEGAGVMISSVEDGGPAQAAGLQVGDIVTALDNEPVGSSVELARRVANSNQDQRRNLEVWRDGHVQTVSAEIEQRERAAFDIGSFIAPNATLLQKRLHIGPEFSTGHVIEIDPDGLHEALKDLEVRFQGTGLLDRLKIIGENREDLQTRIEELEGRLRELEAQLDKLPQR